MKFPLPDHVVKLIAKADRQKMGLKTIDEAAAAAAIKLEKELHNQIANVLRLRDIQFFHSRTDRRTTRPVGEPDFMFAVLVWVEDKTTQSRLRMPQAVAWECKINGKPLDPEQVAMFKRMTKEPNGWTCRVIRSVDDALNELRKLGL